jgi:hypothetical protein
VTFAIVLSRLVQSKREGKGFVAALFWNAAQPGESCACACRAVRDQVSAAGAKQPRAVCEAGCAAQPTTTWDESLFSRPADAVIPASHTNPRSTNHTIRTYPNCPRHGQH